MAQDYIGLFDTPPSRTENRVAVIILAIIVGAALFVRPARHVDVGEISAFIPIVESMMLLSELIIAALLYSLSGLFHSRALFVLATGYLSCALLLIPHALTFPGAFADNGLLGAGVNTTGWLAAVRRVLFPLVVTFYVLLQ